MLPSSVETPSALVEEIAALRRRNEFAKIADLEPRIPATLTRDWLPVADEVAFALCHQHRNAAATKLLLRAWMLEPSQRRASALAYHHYDALFALMRPGPRSAAGTAAADREALRKGFRKWIEEALRREPGSVKDLYRLGEFEAQIESQHDKVALRAFLAAVDAYRALPPATRSLRGDLRKAMVRALYAGARSALRLRQVQLARRMCFDAIREDDASGFLEPVHKFSLAGKICLTTGELDAAERALRIALDAKGPPRRDWLYGMLSELARRRGDGASAVAWIDRNVPPHRRDPALWRQLGDAHRANRALDQALACWESSLRRDRMGRHLTLQRMGEVLREKGELARAERAFADANDFRRRHWTKEDPELLQQAGEAARERGAEGRAREADRRAAEARRAGDGRDRRGGRRP